MRLIAGLALVWLCAAVSSAATMLEDFDALSPEEFATITAARGPAISASVVATDERAGKQNLLLKADVDPATPRWDHLRITFARQVEGAETLTFWFRGDKTCRLYLVVEDSHGTRTDTTIGEGIPGGQWTQAVIPLGNMHVPNATHPNDRASLVDVAALEVYPYPASYPAAGVYSFHIDDIAVTAPSTVAVDRPIDALQARISNAGFEEVAEDGFRGWQFAISRQALVRLTPAPEQAHSGAYSAFLTDQSPVSPHVYGRLTQRVAVQPSTPYRLSCWVRGKAAAGGNHWTDWKSYRLAIPSGTYDWRQVETSFVTSAEQTALELGLNIVDVTEGLWVDDVRLETDLTVGQGPGESKIALWTPVEIIADTDPVQAKVAWQDLPQGGGTCTIRVTAGADVVAAKHLTWDVPSGLVRLSLPGKPVDQTNWLVNVSFSTEDGRQLAVVERSLRAFSKRAAERRLADLSPKLDALRTGITAWGARGWPTDYPTVTRTIAESFIPWVREDIDRGEVRRAVQQISELEEVLDNAVSQCRSAMSVEAVTAPRYVTSAIAVRGGHFEADAVWPDGRRERRPVFFCGYGHFGSVKRDIEKLPAYGLNLIQVEFGPSSTVKEGFGIDLGACSEFESVLARAGASGVAANLLLSPHYFPDWARQRWPHLGNVQGGFISFDIDAPEARQVGQAFLEAVVPRLADRPGLHSLCLSNEPIYQAAPESERFAANWHGWLQARHQTIAVLNAVWDTDYASFDEVPLHSSSDLEPSPELYDWVRFNNDNLAGWHQWMADVIHGAAPSVPVHAKIMNLAFQRHTITWGNDVELFCGLSAIAGNDCANYYTEDAAASEPNWWASEYSYYDLLRSMRGQPVFNSENHVVADRNWDPVPGMHMRNLIWEGAIHGLGASTTWVWERTYDANSDFAGSIMHRPAMCDAHGRAALDLMRLAPEVVALQDRPARVAIVYSTASRVWNPEYEQSVSTVYRGLSFIGEKVDFITDRQLAAGKGDDYEVIIAPAVTHIEQPAYAALAAFSEKPTKALLCVGPGCLQRDEYGRTRDTTDLRCGAVLPRSADQLAASLSEEIHLDHPIRVLDAVSGTPASGVAWLWTRYRDGWLVNLCNYTRRPVRLLVAADGGALPVDLISGMPCGGGVELEPMESALVRM